MPTAPRARSQLASLALPFAALLAAATMVGCRATDIPGSDGTNADGDEGGAWLLGDWSGFYETKSTDKNLDDEEIETTAATAWFKADDDSTDADQHGTFRIDLTELDDAYVTGKYEDYDDRLKLTIDKSTVTAIGSNGKTTTMEYSLTGSILVLTTRKAELQLKRKKADEETDGEDTGDDGKGGDEPGAALVGSYACKDQASHDWRVVIPDVGSFDVVVSGNGLGTLTMSGSMQIEAAGAGRDATLTVNTSSESKYEGDTLALYKIDDRTVDLARLADDGGQLSRFSCRKDD
jgi:hypothetical protein